MKNLLFIFLMLFAGSAFAQSTHTIDFETPGTGADWQWDVGENADNPPLEFVANPDAAGINSSATVAKFTAKAAGNPWALCITDDNLEFTFDANNSLVKIMVYKTNISNIGIKFEGLSPAKEIQLPNTLTGQWEEITFDFSEVIGNTYNRLVIIPDFNFARTEDLVVYFDNIQLPEGTLNSLPEPTDAPADPTHATEDVISIYTEVYDNLPGTNFNPFWGQSTIVTYNYNVAGNNTIKYENLNYQGTDFPVTDVSGYEYLHVDFWTPNATSLSFYLISLGPLEIGYPLDITPETWVSVDIPLSAYVPPVNLDEVFQFKVVGNGVVYFDNWYFWKEPYNPDTDASLSDLQVDGETVDGFAPETLSYDVVLPLGTVDVPVVTATTTVDDAEAAVTDALSLPGTTEVVVTAKDGQTQRSYFVNFTVAQETPGSAYCETEVYHFGDVNTPSAIYLTITNLDAQSVFVEIESARESPVDDLILNVPAGVVLTGNDFSVPGKISNTMIWNDTPPAEFEMNVLWSFEDFGGFWQLSESPVTVPFEASCNAGGPAMVKFRVDMSQYVGEFTNVYVSGSFNGWSGDLNQLLDPDMDDIYEATLEIENGAYEYKFTLDNWTVQEEFTGDEPCVITVNGYHNRALEVSGNATLPLVCWNSCEECPEIFYDVTLSVDMNNYFNGFGNVYVSGSFNGWSGDANQMLDPEMDGVYETTLTLAEGNYEYKFTLDGWAAQEQFDGGEPCTILSGGFVNRLLEVTETTTLPTFCWNLCGPCPEPIELTFNVDMSQFNGSYTNVYVSGEFNNWCGDCNQMLDPDMDMVYEVTLSLNPGAYEYKFTLDNWSQQEEFAGGEPCTVTSGAFTNRYVETEESLVLPIVCWNSCDRCPDYQAGWGGISSNVMPESKITLEELFAPIAEDMVILVGQTGVFWPGQSINTIGEWDTYQGYKVKFANGVNFEFSGAALTDRTVTYEPGMYFVPVLSEEAANVSDVIMQHSGIEFMFDLGNNDIYWPEGGIIPGVFGALETLEPGFAYLAKFTETTTIDFGSVPEKSNTTTSHFNKMVNSTTWNNVSATGSQHIISVNTSSLQSGDFVGTFDMNGTCTGLAQYNGNSQMMPLVVFGNDITTSVKDGMDENEAIEFRIYRNGEELEVNPVFDTKIINHNGLFVENGLSIINEFKLGATNINAANAVSFSIYPNPSNGQFTLVSGNESACDYAILNMQGQQIYSAQVDGTTTIDLSRQPKGVYFIRISNAFSTSIEKIVIE